MQLTRADLAGLARLHESARSVLYRRDGVVVKVPRRGEGAAPAPDRLTNEYLLTAEAGGRGVRRVRELVSIDGLPALILDYVEGETLRAACVERRRELPELLHLAISLAQALEEVHRRRLLHLNLTSLDVLVTGTTATLIDFGSATHRDGPAPLHEPPVGDDTYARYAAPELSGRIGRAVDQRADLYSCGIVLYEMLVGWLPFEAASAAELLHLHLALTPAAPHEVDPGIPRALSDVVMRLLAKDPDDRYQSAHGLVADLQRCAEALEHDGTITPFPLGRADVPGAFRVPAGLYGRDDETCTLLAAAERVREGASETVLVSGPAGVGKSAVVQGVRRAVVRAGDWFVEGRFDQYRQRAPYAAFVQAVSALVDLLLAASPDALAGLATRIAESLGPTAPVLTAVVPRLELVLGARAAAAPAPDTGESGFERALAAFLRAVTRDRAVVLFLDDLQWADVASARLLASLLGGEPIPRLLLVGAYRDEEVDASHPLASALRVAAAAGLASTTVALGRLGAPAVEGLLSDLLRCEPARCRPLAEVIREKTGGNPLCVLQLVQALHAEGAVRYDAAAHAWSWDLDRVRARDVSLNVAALLADELARLPAATVELLAHAACLGHAFALHHLAAVTGRSPEEVVDALAPALEKGLLTRAQGLAFSHPRVRQEARATLPRARRRAVHLAIGRLLLRDASGPERDERVFAVADHLNEAFQLLEGEAERRELAELDLAAGRKARRVAAHEAAIWYLNMGVGLLPADRWERHPELTLALFLEAIEAEYRCGDFHRAEMLSAEALQHVTDPLPRLRMRDVRALSYAALDQGAPALEESREALRLLGVELPAGADALEADARTLREEISRRVPRIEALAGAAPVFEPRLLSVLRALSTVAAAAQGRDPALLEVAVCRMVLLSVEHGSSPLAALAYAWYGALLCERHGEVQAGHRFGQLALEVVGGAGAPELEPRVRTTFNALVRPWKEHVRRTLDPLRQAARAAADAGDLECAAAAGVRHVVHLLCAGEPLALVRQAVAAHRDAAERSRRELPAQLLRLWGQAVENLVGDAEDPCRLSGALLDEAAVVPGWIERGVAPLIWAVHACRAMLQVIFDEPADALESARLAERHAPADDGGFLRVVVAFHHALALVAELPRADAATRAAWAGELAGLRARLAGWATHAPMNVAPLCALVDAEVARAAGDTLTAMAQYRTATRAASELGFRHVEALAYEREAALYVALGREDFAALCVRRAADRYRLWGAARKVADLEERHGHLLTREASSAVDAAAIVHASSALSQELHVQELLTQLMRIVIESAGAERGVLLQRRGDRFVIQAKGVVGQPVVTMQGAPVESDPDLALSVVNYVVRTLTPVVLDDAYRESVYSGDHVLARRQTRSLLCLPITHQGKLSALLYLENNLAPGVFTADRLELLEALSSQAAISMENAALYSHLEATVGELRTAQEALRKNEEFLALIVENLPDMVFVKDADGLRFVRMNRAGEELLGLARTDLVGKSDFDFFPAEEAKAFTDADRAVLESGRLRDIPEEPIETSQGRRWLHTKKIPIADAAGRPLYLLGISEDVTERKRAEEAMREANERLRSVLRAATAYSIIGTDPRGVIKVFNEGAELMLGYRAGEVVDRLTPEVFHDRGEIEARAAELGVAPGMEVFLAAARAGHIETREWTYVRKGGARLTVALTVAPLRSEGGELTGFTGIARDVSGEKHLEQQLRQSQKLESIGLLAGGIAHDFNNVLTPILGQTQLVLDGLPQDDPAREPLADVLECALRAKTLTQQLLAFGRRQVIELRSVDLRAVITQCATILRRTLREDVELDVRLAPELRPVRADPGQLQQVLINLAINAQDAMPTGGRLLVETSDVDVDASYAERQPGVAPGPHVMMTVTDTGVGMDAATLEHVFEPFFTTKEVGKGTGLGLSMVYGIVKQHGGTISAYSERGRGTSFKILLPASAEPAGAARPDAEPPVVLRGTETVLVAEDDPKVRRVACTMLANLGYRVVTDQPPERLAEAARAFAGHVDLLLTDVVMPGTNGKALFDALRRERPDLRVLYMSGYTSAAVDVASLGDGHFIQKPFSMVALSHALRRVLDGK